MAVILNFKIDIKFYRSIDQNQSNLTISHHEIAKANDYYRKQVPYSTKNPSREHSKGANRCLYIFYFFRSSATHFVHESILFVRVSGSAMSILTSG